MDRTACKAALFASLFVAACGGPAPLVAPRVEAVANPDNALSTIVSFAPAAVGCAQVTASAPGETDVVTPCDAQSARAGRVVVLGLKPQLQWSHVLRIQDGARSVDSEAAVATTGPLPDDLKTVHLDVASGAATGYTLIAYAHKDHAYALAFDGAGALRWYRGFEAPAATLGPDLKLQANGHFTMYLGCTHGADQCPGSFVEFLPTGEIVAIYSPPSNLLADNHEMWLRARANGAGLDAFYFAYDFRPADLSALGGANGIVLAGHCLVRQGSDGSTSVPWSSWNSLAFDGWVEAPLPAAAPAMSDFDHPNALDFDEARGQYLVSLRNYDQVMAVDAKTGTPVWSLGGVNPTLQRVGDDQGFSGQHSLRMLPGDRLLIYDNGSNVKSTRAVEYQLDLKAGTATQIWEYRPATPIFTPYMGSVQRLANGDTLVGFSMSSQIHQVAADGTLVWNAKLMADAQTPQMFYRAFRIASLYGYQQP